MANILVVCAHPDDETLGMGGTIAKLVAGGHEVWVVTFSDGVSSRGPFLSSYVQVERKSHFEAACRVLGAHPYLTQPIFPDQQLDLYNLLIAKALSAVLKEVKPSAVYTHHIGDCNQDHRAVAQATLIATRPQPGCTVQEVYAYEVPSSTEWGFGLPDFTPNVFVNISGTLEAKLKAMACYKDEVREWPHSRSLKALEHRARHWGSVAGVEAAEAFVLLRKLS